MNSKFIRTLKQVGFNSNAFPDAVKQLENGSNVLQRDLSKHALANSEILKQYAISELSQIKEEQKRIESWHKSLVKKDKSLKAIELLENRNELHYFAEILNLIDSVTDDLNKHLATYYPDMFKVETQKGQTINFDLMLSEIRKSENQFWKGLPMDKTINHFEILTTRKNKNGNSYLTKEQFISFLKRGFLNDKNQPVQKINCSAGEKGLVIKLFYDFYELAVSHYKHTNKKVTFINLFNDCFDNWKPETVKSFFKPGKTKETW